MKKVKLGRFMNRNQFPPLTNLRTQMPQNSHKAHVSLNLTHKLCVEEQIVYPHTQTFVWSHFHTNNNQLSIYCCQIHRITKILWKYRTFHETVHQSLYMKEDKSS